MKNIMEVIMLISIILSLSSLFLSEYELVIVFGTVGLLSYMISKNIKER